MEYTLYILGFDSRFRIPPGRFCFACLVSPPFFCPQLLRLRPLPDDFFPLFAPLSRIFPSLCTLHRSSRPTFSHLAAPFVRPFSPVAPPKFRLFAPRTIPQFDFFSVRRALFPAFSPKICRPVRESEGSFAGISVRTPYRSNPDIGFARSPSPPAILPTPFLRPKRKLQIYNAVQITAKKYSKKSLKSL